MRAIVSVHNLHNLKAHQNIYSSSCEIHSVHVQLALLSCLSSINCNNICKYNTDVIYNIYIVNTHCQIFILNKIHIKSCQGCH